MSRKPTASFTPEEVRVVKFLLHSLGNVDFDPSNDRRCKFFLWEMHEQGSRSDDDTERAKLARWKDIAVGIYEREFCG